MDLIFLAAGNSTRFGANKLLYKLNGKCMYRYGIEAAERLLQEGLLESVIVVTQYEEIICDIKEHFSKLQTVRNPHPEDGISGSIRLGVEKLIESENKCGKSCMFMVADQPYLTVESLRKMIESQKISEKGILVSASYGRMGNPVIFDQKYYAELRSLKGDVGGKQVIKKHLDDVQMFEMPAPELKDLDSPTEICE